MHAKKSRGLRYSHWRLKDPLFLLACGLANFEKDWLRVSDRGNALAVPVLFCCRAEPHRLALPCIAAFPCCVFFFFFAQVWALIFLPLTQSQSIMGDEVEICMTKMRCTEGTNDPSELLDTGK